MTTPDGPLNIDHWRDEADSVIQKRNAYWKTLATIRRQHRLTDLSSIASYMIEHYGIKPIINTNGDITSDYEIVDEAKYLIYLLTYQ